MQARIVSVVLLLIAASVGISTNTRASGDRTSQRDWEVMTIGTYLYHKQPTNEPALFAGSTYEVHCFLSFRGDTADDFSDISPVTSLLWDLDGDGSFETIDNPSRIEIDEAEFTDPAERQSYRFVAREYSTPLPGDHSVGCRMSFANGLEATATSPTFTVLASPPPGTSGVSIAGGAEFTRTPQVKLNIVWPRGARYALISNDGGFPADRSRWIEVSQVVDWRLNSSITGLFTKNVYVRFYGISYLVDPETTYSDDIVLDTTAPEVLSASVRTAATTGPAAEGGKITVKAKDDISGVAALQVNKRPRSQGAKTVRYGRPATAPAGGIAYVRAQDRAGNWSKWQKVATAPAKSAVSPGPR